MAKLKSDVKAFIVTALACYDTPTQVCEAVKEEFGLEISRMHVSGYDPTKVQGETLGKNWRDLFHETRQKFKDGVTDVPIAQRAYRLRVMQRILTRVESQGNRALALQTIEQAAKETGDIYVNRNRDAGGEQDPPTPVKIEIAVVDARKRG